MGRPGYTHHVKFHRLAYVLDRLHPGLGQILARGFLDVLWETAYENGDDYIGDELSVEAMAGWKGEPGVLCRALMEAGGGPNKAGYIEPVPGVPGAYQVHDLWHHAPDYVQKRRARELQRRAKGDERRALSGEWQSPSAERTTPSAERRTLTGQRPENGVTPAPAPAPAPAHAGARAGPAPALGLGEGQGLDQELGPPFSVPFGERFPGVVALERLLRESLAHTVPFPIAKADRREPNRVAEARDALEAQVSRLGLPVALAVCRERALTSKAQTGWYPRVMAYYVPALAEANAPEPDEQAKWDRIHAEEDRRMREEEAQLEAEWEAKKAAKASA